MGKSPGIQVTEQKVQRSKFEGHVGKVQGTPEPSSRNTKESFSSEAT